MVLSTVTATLRQLVMFVDKVVEEDSCMLLANELESITLPDETTQTLGPTGSESHIIRSGSYEKEDAREGRWM